MLLIVVVIVVVAVLVSGVPVFTGCVVFLCFAFFVTHFILCFVAISFWLPIACCCCSCFYCYYYCLFFFFSYGKLVFRMTCYKFAGVSFVVVVIVGDIAFVSDFSHRTHFSISYRWAAINWPLVCQPGNANYWGNTIMSDPFRCTFHIGRISQARFTHYQNKNCVARLDSFCYCYYYLRCCCLSLWHCFGCCCYVCYFEFGVYRYTLRAHSELRPAHETSYNYDARNAFTGLACPLFAACAVAAAAATAAFVASLHSTVSECW